MTSLHEFFPQTEPVGIIVYTILASDPDYSSGGNFHFVFTNPVSKYVLAIWHNAKLIYMLKCTIAV